jgi:predicted N-acetyltransferase YhbS
MTYQSINTADQVQVAEFFSRVFSDSEGAGEGRLIGGLAGELVQAIDQRDILGFACAERNEIIGAIFFSRLYFEQGVNVFMLAPVAVSTAHQGKGFGQALIRYGLDEMRQRSVDVVITYGDPAFYSRVGFNTLSQERIKPPLELSMPQGWLGLALGEEEIPKIAERPRCVEAFNNPLYW